jgi:hypothetical protein
MKNTLGWVAHPSFFLASTTAIVGAPSMTQLHRGMGGAAPQPTHLHRSYPHQPERRLVEDIAFRVLAADNQPNFRTLSDFRQDPFEDDGGTFRAGSEDRAGSGCVESGRAALDGTKIKANASTHKAMT